MDNGGQYVNKALSEFLALIGINHEPITPYYHESNGNADRFNRTISQIVRTTPLSSRLPKNLSAEAFNMEVCVKKCTTQLRYQNNSVRNLPRKEANSWTSWLLCQESIRPHRGQIQAARIQAPPYDKRSKDLRVWGKQWDV